MSKRAAVTGGVGALGQAVVSRLIEDGFDVHLSAIDESEKARYSGPGSVAVVALTDLDAVREWATSIGGTNCLVGIAGGFSMARIESSSKQDYDRMFDTNARTAANCLAAFAGQLTRDSSIVLVGAQAYEGAAGMAHYAASKAAVVSMARSAALEWQDKGVRVNCILPNTIDTPANRAAMPKANFETWAKPAEIADVISFLVSDKAAVVSGNAIRVGRTV